MYNVKPSDKLKSSFDSSGKNINSSKIIANWGSNVVVERQTCMSSLNLPEGLRKQFQRPMLGRRSYSKREEEALQKCSLGQKKRVGGMEKLLKGKFRMPDSFVPDKVEHGSDSESEDDPMEDLGA